MKTLLVTLVSEQTIQNVRFILEKRNNETDFLFISTIKMEDKGIKSWIQKVCNIENMITKVVDQFSLDDIETKLNEVDYKAYNNILVNITGGTKIMSLATADFFKKLNAELNVEIFYLTEKNSILQIYPKKEIMEQKISKPIALKEYIESHGFLMNEKKMSGIGFEYTKKYFKLYSRDNDKYHETIEKLREYRDTNNKEKINGVEKLSEFINDIEYPQEKLDKYDVRYLTGDWFEEYIYYSLKEELLIPEENIKTGVTLIKNNIQNEFDVIFINQGKLFTIECKTSILNGVNSILTDTIYKTAALQKNLGLYSNFSIFTLSSKDNKEVKETDLDRAKKLFNIGVFCKEDIEDCTSIHTLLIDNTKY